MIRIDIKQINDQGANYRTLTQYARDLGDLNRRMRNAQRAYNLDRTQIFVDGIRRD